jgi:hypothetical protein
MPDNKWSRPAAPPPPLFFLVKQVNDELIEKIIGQQILYYPIDLETTKFHKLYGEAIEKTFLAPVRVYALVEFTEFSTKYMDNVGVDTESEIQVHFHKRRLEEDQDLYVREGDFVLYGDKYYEIVTLSKPKNLFGQVEHSFEISAKCRKARKGLFDAT